MLHCTSRELRLTNDVVTCICCVVSMMLCMDLQTGKALEHASTTRGRLSMLLQQRGELAFALPTN